MLALNLGLPSTPGHGSREQLHVLTKILTKIQDSILEHMTLDDWNAALKPKVQGSWNLHDQLQRQPLDFFIMLSSVLGVLGNASQSNYSAAGAFQDALARYRVARHMPAVALDLGLVKSVGYVAENKGITQRLSRAGLPTIDEQQVLAMIESAVLDPLASQLTVGLNVKPGSVWEESVFSRDARFVSLQPRQSAGAGRAAAKSAAQNGNKSQDLAQKLAAGASLQEGKEAVTLAITEKLAGIFMLPVEDFPSDRGPAAYGVDSLVAVEIRTMLAMRTGIDVSIFQVLQSPSLDALAELVAVKAGCV